VRRELSRRCQPMVILLFVRTRSPHRAGTDERELLRVRTCIRREIFVSMSSNSRGVLRRRRSKEPLRFPVLLTCLFERSRVCCAISRATGNPSSLLQTLRRQASCRARRNPVSPRFTNLPQGKQQDASRFMVYPIPLNRLIMGARFEKRDGT